MKRFFLRVNEVLEQYNRTEVNDPIVKRGEKKSLSRIFSNGIFEGMFRALIGKDN